MGEIRSCKEERGISYTWAGASPPGRPPSHASAPPSSHATVVSGRRGDGGVEGGGATVVSGRGDGGVGRGDRGRGSRARAREREGIAGK